MLARFGASIGSCCFAYFRHCTCRRIAPRRATPPTHNVNETHVCVCMRVWCVCVCVFVCLCCLFVCLCCLFVHNSVTGPHQGNPGSIETLATPISSFRTGCFFFLLPLCVVGRFGPPAFWGMCVFAALMFVCLFCCVVGCRAATSSIAGRVGEGARRKDAKLAGGAASVERAQPPRCKASSAARNPPVPPVRSNPAPVRGRQW